MSVNSPLRALGVSVALVLFALALAGCSRGPAPEGFSRNLDGTGVRPPTPVPSPAVDPIASPTPIPTATPTPVPTPTATPAPTSTPPPTATPSPSPTPAPRRFTLAAIVEPTGAALIELDPLPSPDGRYVAGTVVRLQLADPLPNATFIWWDGDASGAGPRITMTVDRDLRVRALFAMQDPSTATPTPTSTATPIPSPTATPVPLTAATPTRTTTASTTATTAPGALRWQYTAESWFDAAPTLRDDTLYVGSRDGRLYALSAASGEPVWSFMTDSQITGRAAATEASVFVGILDGTVRAIDRATGTPAWEFATGGRIWSGVTVSDGTVFVGSEDRYVYALGADLGSLKWRFETGGNVVGRPAVAGDTVYATSFDDHVYALDTATGEVRWKAELQSASISTPLVSEGLLYVGSLDDHLYALDAATGGLVWNFWAGDNVLTSAAASDGRVFFGSDDGYVYALDARDGSTLWSFETDDKVRSSPLVHDGVVYIGSDDDHFYALDAATGSQRWRFATGNDVQATAGVADGTVYFGSHDRRVYGVAAGGTAPLSVPPAPTPAPSFAQLSPEELRATLDFAFTTTLDVEHAGIEFGEEGSSVVTKSFSAEVIEIFENGYYLLTGNASQQDGWVPRIFSGDEYIAYIDENGGGSPFLKAALGFCCQRTEAGLELIIRGDQPVSGVISTVAHEAGHARQAMANPVQTKAEPGSNLDALQEAEAYAFEVALTRKLGEYTGIVTSVFPDLPGIREFTDRWREFLRTSLDDRSRVHDRGRLFMWLAVLHDPELADQKAELLDEGILSPESVLALHNRLIRITPGEADAYAKGLTGSLSDDLNFIFGTIDRRIGHQVQFPELAVNVPDLVLSP